MGSVSENLTAYTTGGTLLSTLTLKHANTATNIKDNTYIIHLDHTLVISDM